MWPNTVGQPGIYCGISFPNLIKAGSKSTAVGRYQFIHNNGAFGKMAAEAGIKDTDLFDAATQDKLAVHYLGGEKQLNKMIENKEYAKLLAKQLTNEGYKADWCRTTDCCYKEYIVEWSDGEELSTINDYRTYTLIHRCVFVISLLFLLI